MANSRQTDENRNPVGDYIVSDSKTITFDGGTTDGIGDINGANNPATIFTVTGSVLVKILAYCTTDLVGDTATVEVGTTTDTAEIIAQTVATGIDSGDLWHDASPDSNVETSTVLTEKVIANGGDIVITAGTADITAGAIVFYALYQPISEGASVVPA